MYSCVAGILARAWVIPGPTCSSPRGVRRCGSGVTLAGRPQGPAVQGTAPSLFPPLQKDHSDGSHLAGLWRQVRGQQRRRFNTGLQWNEGWRAGR